VTQDETLQCLVVLEDAIELHDLAHLHLAAEDSAVVLCPSLVADLDLGVLRVEERPAGLRQADLELLLEVDRGALAAHLALPRPDLERDVARLLARDSANQELDAVGLAKHEPLARFGR